MTFSQKTNGFWEIISLFCCEREGSVAPTWNLQCNWGTRSVYHAYADAEYQSCIPRWQEHTALEMSMLNAGAMFDVELPIAWSQLTG